MTRRWLAYGVQAFGLGLAFGAGRIGAPGLLAIAAAIMIIIAPLVEGREL